jgi:dTDP-4-amino-4,6-dideoxygalactose transaminase
MLHLSKINMVDLQTQYQNIKTEIDIEIVEVLQSAQYIKGPKVAEFEENLAHYLEVKEVISCANGTDALQIAMMALGLKPGDEIIVPAFTYVATAEVIALLGLTPIMVDVDRNSFNITAEIIEKAITKKTKAIVPVHLFGQGANMEAIKTIAQKHHLYIIEDNAQAIGADFAFANGSKQKYGTIGDIGCTSFFPSKNLGCYGDGGAIFTNNKELADKIRMIANHGQNKKYHHRYVGVNSRLDAIQAAILNVKLKYLDDYIIARQKVAQAYDKAFKDIDTLQIPYRNNYSTHVFHQYTLQVKEGKRDQLKKYLSDQGIPSMIYYPIPLYKQEAFKPYFDNRKKLSITEELCQNVLSLPIHTEMDNDTLQFITQEVNNFFR